MRIKEYIKNSPYRVLGVTTNDSASTLMSHNSRMKAFASIGKLVSFPYDFDEFFGEKPKRHPSDLASAISALSTPEGRLRHGMFWFMNMTATDAKALEHLARTGSPMAARRIWEKGEQDMPSLQNQLVCNLLMNPRTYTKAIQDADMLYHRFGSELIAAICGGLDIITPDELMPLFMEEIVTVSGKDIAGWDKAVSRCQQAILARFWAESKATALIKMLQEALNAARSSECKIPLDHYDIARSLMLRAELSLKELKELTGKHSSLLSRYTATADTLCEFVLDEEIAYYNRSGWSWGKVNRVLPLLRFCFRYAATTRFKNRCKKNINIVLGRRKDAPLFPNGTPDDLVSESDRQRRNTGICAILSALGSQGNTDS